MDIVELKTKIKSKTLDSSVLILKYTDNKYLCNSYVKAICSLRNLTKLNITSLSELPSVPDFFGADYSYLYVLDTDELTEYPTKDNKNLVIITKKVPDNLSIDFIEIPKLVNWQIEEYVSVRLSGLNKSQVQWLCEICKYDIHRLDKECEKLDVFLPANQKIIFNLLNTENGYCDLNTLTIFDLSEAIMKLDKNKINDILNDRDYLDLEPAGLVTILLNNYRKLISVAYSNSWSSTMNISEKQYGYYKKNVCSLYMKKKDCLINIFQCLTEIDFLLKSGKLDYTDIIDYIVCHIFNYV